MMDWYTDLLSGQYGQSLYHIRVRWFREHTGWRRVLV